jgi:hypothetical protein
VKSMPESYRERITPLMAKARALLEAGHRVEPIAFVGSLAKGTLDFVLLKTADGNIQDGSMAQVRRTGQRLDADFVFTIMEAWGLPPRKAPQYAAIIERFGSIEASPYAIDMLAFALETYQGPWVAQAEIKPKGISKRKKTFDDPQFHFVEPTSGRFVSLLPGPPPISSSLES